jgi:HlyD family secretion protein
MTGSTTFSLLQELARAALERAWQGLQTLLTALRARIARIGSAPAETSAATQSSQGELRLYEALAYGAIVALFGGLGGWAALSSIQGAVIVPGTVVVETNPKKVQHLEGGIIALIQVKNGQRVAAGETLARMDDTEPRANLAVVESQIEDLLARRGRLLAERDGASLLDAAGAIGPHRWQPRDQKVWDGQQRLLASRRAAQEGKRKQSLERISQLEQAIKGLDAQNDARVKQASAKSKESKAVLALEDKGLTNVARTTAVRSETARLEGEIAQTAADIARYRVQISETQSKSLEDESTYLSEVLNELRDVEGRLAEALERRNALEAKVRRVAVISPRSGFVHNLMIHTIGGVAGPGETLMEIIPEEDVLVLEGKLAVAERDRVELHQPARVRFPAFDARVTPELEGKVTRISPSAVQESKDTAPFYQLRIELSEAELKKLGDKRLVPGMPCEVFVETERRSVLVWLMKPILDQMAHVGRSR